MSHPTWVRELKLVSWINKLKDKVSHPTWVRELKQVDEFKERVNLRRTLRGCVN